MRREDFMERDELLAVHIHWTEGQNFEVVERTLPSN
jgi:hypothetical protein